MLRKRVQLFGEDQGGIPPKRRWPKLRGLRKSALNTFWFVLLPCTTICFGGWWKRNRLKRSKIERLNWICNLSNSKKQEEEEDQKSCKRLKHLSLHCIYPPRNNSDWLHLAEGFCLLCNGFHLPHWNQFLNSRIKSYTCFPERRNDDKSPSILISNTNTNTNTITNTNTMKIHLFERNFWRGGKL